MYRPPKFALSEVDTLAALGRGGFAHLATHSGGEMLVTPLPLLYDEARHCLVGHVARANPHWRAEGPSVAIFAGAQAYVSPSFYPTKRETAKVVPTWNYDVLTVHGRLLAHDDPAWVNQPARNRDGVAGGLRASGSAADQSVADRVVRLGSTNANARG